MKKYQIVEVTEKLNHAGTKATIDFALIAEQCGYERVNVAMNTTQKTKIAKVQRQIGYFFDWNKVYRTIEDNAIVLLQHPFHYPQLTRENILTKLKEKKHVKYISIIHDVEELRQFRYNEYYKNEFEFMIKVADVIVVHNDKMKEFFLQKGVAEKKLISLEIFDYLQSGDEKKSISFARAITIAGNLDTTKCGYVGQLDQIENVEINLYGPNFNQKMKCNPNIHYHGILSPDEVPSVLTSGFGVVWDGDGLQGGVGEAGQYVRYNNPHKLSLYLSSGLPVIIWREAAEAKFVKEYNLGIVIDSLQDLSTIMPNFKEEDYLKIKNNVNEISKKLKNGYYGKKAIKQAEILIGE